MPAARTLVKVLLAVGSAAAILGTACRATHPETMRATQPEQVVFARTSDDLIQAGVMFSPVNASARQVAVLWIHGWGVNFYQPSYIAIGRALAQRGFTVINGNTRMHDLGNVEAYRGDTRIRGGGYWGVANDEVLDIAGWLDVLGKSGFDKVILVGHSAGWAAVRTYVTERPDPRVIGLVLASGAVRADTRSADQDQLSQAKEFMARNEADALIRDPKRSFPSYISAATFLGIVNEPVATKDFFGVQTTNAGITHVRVPLLALFGTSGDVGGQEDLDILTAAIQRQQLPIKVTTALIKGADHMYTGEETQVADVISRWIDVR